MLVGSTNQVFFKAFTLSIPVGVHECNMRLGEQKSQLYLPGLLTILVKSIDNTNTNTFTGNTFPTHQQSQVRLKGGPAGCAFFLSSVW